MQEGPGRNVISELAQQYAAYPEQLLGENLGRAATLEELAEFVTIAGATIVGSMYAIIRECKDPAEAEAWLRKTLGMTGAQVRMRGSEAILKFDVTIKEAPNTLYKRKEIEQGQHQLQRDLGTAECKCNVDSEGRCTKCAKMLAGYFQTIFEPFMKMRECADQVKDMCTVCQPAQTDYAIAGLVPTLFKSFMNGVDEADKKAEVGREILAMLYGMAGQTGVKQMPLTEKAYANAMEGIQKLV